MAANFGCCSLAISTSYRHLSSNLRVLERRQDALSIKLGAPSNFVTMILISSKTLDQTIEIAEEIDQQSSDPVRSL